MPLTLAQKSSIRRHLGFPVVGLYRVSPAGGTLASGQIGYRFFEAYGTLEYRMNNLGPDEEARLTGQAMASVAIIGPDPAIGDTISVTLSGGDIASAQTITATAQATGNDPRLDLGNSLVAALISNSVLTAANVQAMTPYGTGPFGGNQIPVPEVAFIAPTEFNISVAGSGILIPQITVDGKKLPPAAKLDGTNLISGYLPLCDGLESGYLQSAENMDTIQADVWKGRSNEHGQRLALYLNWVDQMANFLGIPTYPRRQTAPGQHRPTQFV